MPLILGAQSATAAGAVITNSCRFNQPDDDEFTRTLGTPTDNDKWTLSVWVKRGNLGVFQCIADAASSGTTYTEIYFNTSDVLRWDERHSDVYVGLLVTDRVFRDTNAWYHIVFVYDSGNASAGDRMKIYINGTEETSFSTDTNPTQDLSSVFNSAVAHSIGSASPEGATTGFWDGYMSDVILCDGQAYAASDFGEFNEDSPTIWQPTDPSGLTFGDNGFYLDFKDSSNLGNDANGGTDWTEVNIAAADQCEDNPTNNFCTMNYLFNDPGYAATFTLGNNVVNPASSRGVPGTMGFKTGKWYWEARATGVDIGNGIVSESAVNSSILYENTYASGFDNYSGNRAYSYLGELVATNILMATDYTTDPFGNAAADGSKILGVAVDLDNNFLYWSVDGVWQNSSDPESGATGTGGIAVASYTGTPATGDVLWFPLVNTLGGNACQLNFGNGQFGETAVVSSNSDGNDYGSFEFPVPSGYYALCTKNLGEFGG
jgi:hypothetical protein